MWIEAINIQNFVTVFVKNISNLYKGVPSGWGTALHCLVFCLKELSFVLQWGFKILLSLKLDYKWENKNVMSWMLSWNSHKRVLHIINNSINNLLGERNVGFEPTIILNQHLKYITEVSIS